MSLLLYLQQILITLAIQAYGINLLPFATFAMKYYGNDPCKRFRPKEGVDSDLIAQMHKAMSIIQSKVIVPFS